MSRQPNLDDYLQKGMYGEKQLKPDEKENILEHFENVSLSL